MINLISHKKTSYHIVYSKESLEATRFAAMELQRYLYEASSCCVPVFSDKCPRRSNEIIIGKEARNINYEYLLKDLGEEDFIIKTLDNSDILIASKSTRGDLYGVYYFLNKVINLVCYHKSEITFDILDEIRVEKLNIIKTFTFEYREVYFTDAFDGVFASMNCLNSNLARVNDAMGGKVKWYNFHHSFKDLVDPEIYFDTHPEYFSLVNGIRIKDHAQLCLSNPDVLEIALNTIYKWLKSNPFVKVISVSQDEWLGHFDNFACQCENCAKIDQLHNAFSGSIITFVNKIARALSITHPDLLIHTFAYQYSRKAPTNIKIHKNVIVRLSNIEATWDKPLIHSNNEAFLNDLKDWSKLTSRLYIWDYSVNYRNYLLPFPNLTSMYQNIKTYKENNIKGILMQGNFSNGGRGSFDELKSFVIARLLNDVNYDLKLLVNDFCVNFYKQASSLIIELIWYLESLTQNHPLWLYDDSDNLMFNDENVSKCLELSKQAIKLVSKSEEVLYKRVLAVNLSMRYLYITRLSKEKRLELIEEFIDDCRYLKITEIFERTNLDYSFEVMKESQYAKERVHAYSLYYIMK